MLALKENSDTKRLPMMPLREAVVFPYMMIPFVVGREFSGSANRTVCPHESMGEVLSRGK